MGWLAGFVGNWRALVVKRSRIAQKEDVKQTGASPCFSKGRCKARKDEGITKSEMKEASKQNMSQNEPKGPLSQDR